MSVSLTQSNSAETNTVTSQAVVLSGALATGDLILVCGRWGNTIGTITASDGPGTTYTHVTGSPRNEGNSGTDQVFLLWGILGAGQSSLTVTVSVAGGGSHRITVGAFDYNSTTGWNSTQAEPTNTNASSTSGTTATTAAITTSNTDLVFGAFETGVTVTNIATSGAFTIQTAGGTAGNGFASTGKIAAADAQNAAPGSYNCTFTWTTNATWGSLIAAFMPTVAGASIAVEDDSYNCNAIQQLDPIISIW